MNDHPSPVPPGDVAAQGPPPLSGLGLFVKIVVLPTLLVGVFVASWVMLRLLFAAPIDVDTCIDRLSRGGTDRWRAAVELAGLLQDPDHAALRSDGALAGHLATILQREIDGGRMSPDDIALRMYLCRALGEFRTSAGLDVLLRAGASQRDSREIDVRRSAIEALAVRIAGHGSEALRDREELVAVLTDASSSADGPLRATAAFTLGVLGGQAAERRLVAMLSDPHADARYNAATGLARHGNSKAVDVLLEMLDPDQTAGLEREKQQAARDAKRRMILSNALRAAARLVAANADAMTGRLRAAVRRLTVSPTEAPIRVLAIQTLSRFPQPAYDAARSSAEN